MIYRATQDLVRSGKIRFLAIMAALAVLSGCISGFKPKEQPPAVPAASTVQETGPSIEDLPGGRHGFVVKESSAMDKDAMSEFNRANTMAKEGKNDKAAEILEEVIKKSPKLASPHINAAFIYMQMGKTDKAEEHFKSALAIIPNHPVAANEYGLLLRKAGKFKDARKVYEDAISAFPDYLPLHRNLGILCDIYINDQACATREFEIYSKSMPKDEKVRMWMAELKMRDGKK